jgi:hypothetical protein
MPNWSFDVTGESSQRNALDAHLREITALENCGRADEIHGTVEVTYSDEDARRSTVAPALESKGVVFRWNHR